MEQITVRGLCVREADTGESDKVLTLVTMEYGKITVSGKGVKSLKSPHMASCQPFCYSSFTLRKSKKYFYISDSELIESFYGLRSDLDRISLAAYICDICADISVENMPDQELLRLTLNALYALSAGNTELRLIKAAYELKSACVSGYYPELDACCGCGKTGGEFWLDVMNGRIICTACRPVVEREEQGEENGTARMYLFLTADVLNAMRYISDAPVSRFLSFKLDEDGLHSLSTAAESYLLNHLEHGFYTLDFYKSLNY